MIILDVKEFYNNKHDKDGPLKQSFQSYFLHYVIIGFNFLV